MVYNRPFLTSHVVTDLKMQEIIEYILNLNQVQETSLEYANKLLAPDSETHILKIQPWDHLLFRVW